MNSRRHYDVAIIGAGMSGLAAGIRAAHFGRSVCIFERHNAPGGLNGFYSLGGRKYDVGLHAVTNYVPAGAKSMPLVRLLRQLRIEREEWALREQRHSKVSFLGHGQLELTFTNRVEVLESEIARLFPSQVDGFRRLAELVRATPFDPDSPYASAREVFGRYLSDPLCREMLLCPVMFYGSATEQDLPFASAAVLFSAIFLEGLARPAEGVRRIIRVLLEKYRAAGGERRMKCGVRRIVVRGGRAEALVLDEGDEITADTILSSIGAAETAALLGEASPPAETGVVTYVETIAALEPGPAALGWDDAVVFFNDSERLHYERPADAVDPRSGVIAFPSNFAFEPGEPVPDGLFRVTCLANYDRWAPLSEPDYQAQKQEWFGRVQASARRFLAPVDEATFAGATRATDMFTPRTIERFTGHRNGAIYGAPRKSFYGATGVANVHLCGTDQGLLGIVGSMLSGVIMANRHALGRVAPVLT